MFPILPRVWLAQTSAVMLVGFAGAVALADVPSDVAQFWNNDKGIDSGSRATRPASPDTTWVVTSTADSGPGSLRQALVDAQSGDAITFNLPGPSSTITLTSGELMLDKDVTITGPGPDMLTVRRDDSAAAFRIFNIRPDRVVTIEGMTISNGRAVLARGGGILNSGGTLTLNRCTLSGNAASNGGALFNEGLTAPATARIDACTVSGNTALGTSSGGGLMNFTQSGPATMIVTNSTISGNTSVSSGGGLLNRGYGSGAFGSEAQLTVLNCTISGNSAETGAGLLNGGYNAVGRLKIANSTVAENTGTYGRGIHNSGFAFVAIANCIFKSALPIGNAANLTTTVHNHGGIADSYGYNLTDDGGGGILTISTDQINTDPMLGPLQDNGGATWTHAPLGGSPAVDRGKNFGLDANNNPMPVDQRNHLRPVRYSGSIPMPQGGDGSDIGAVESPPGVLPTATRSRKAHGLPGEFDVDLPATGALGVESRSGGSNNEHRIVLTFAQPITLSGATVVEGTAQIGAMALNGDNTELTLTLAATNAQKIVLALQDVSDGTRTGDVGVRMGLLLGDSSGDGFVNSGDALQSRARSGLPSSNTTFRSDVNTDGFVNSGDTIIVRSRSGTSLP